MLPAAPAWFSMTTPCPHASGEARAEHARAMSAAVPGENGTMILTGFVGIALGVAQFMPATAAR